MSRPASADAVEVGDLDAVDVLHREEALAGPFVDDGGDDDVGAMRELGGDRLHVLRLMVHVDFFGDVEGELAVDGLEGEGVEAGLEPEDRLEDPEVGADEALDVGVDDFDGDFASVVEAGAVDLREGGGGDGPRVEFGEGFFDGDAELGLDVGFHAPEGPRRDLVLKSREGLDVFLREEVGAAAECLADLDHEALEAEDAAVDAAGALSVVAAHAAVVVVLRHAALAAARAPCSRRGCGRRRRRRSRGGRRLCHAAVERASAVTPTFVGS